MSTVTTSRYLEAALGYAARGWRVLPLHTPRNGDLCSCGKDCGKNRGKHPRTPNGLTDATTDPDVVRQWWTRWPDANVGIATGEASGLFAVDGDPRSGGDDTLDKLATEHGPLPQAPQAMTGSGGTHDLFKWPGFYVKSRSHALGPGVDVKGDGGYIVAAPSLHASGREYVWEVSSDPEDTPLADAPPWIIRALKTADEASKGNQSDATEADVAKALAHLPHLSDERRDNYEDWINVGMVLHWCDPGEEMAEAWEDWSRESTAYEENVCAEKWASFHTDGNGRGKKITIGSLIEWARADGAPEDLAKNTTAAGAIETIVLSPNLSLYPITVDRSPKRFTARFDLLINGGSCGIEIVATDTRNGARGAWSDILEACDLNGHVIDPKDTEAAKLELKKLLTRKRLSEIADSLRKSAPKAEADDRPMMLDATLDYMRDHLELTHLCGDPVSIWSERFAQPIRRGDFMSRVEPKLLEKIKACSDYPAPTEADPTKPIKHLQQVLRPAWSALTNVLPNEIGGTLGPDSKAAAAFRAEICGLWHAPETWMKFDAQGDTPAHVERMSLASRVRELKAHDRTTDTVAWRRVLRGVNAFYRVEDGVVWLGMRADLCQGEINRRTIPAIRCQHDLTTLVHRYGLGDTTGIIDRIKEGKTRQRLTVLSRDVCDYLIDCADTPVPNDEEAEGTKVIEGLRIDPISGEVLDA